MNKERRINIRLTERDYDIISKKAEFLDMTISEYMRMCAVSKMPKGFKLSDAEETDVKGQLEFTDVNLNIAEKGKKKKGASKNGDEI